MADPMSAEWLADLKETAGRAIEQLEGDGSSTEECVQAMPYLLVGIDLLRAQLRAVNEMHGRPRTQRYGSGCIGCGILWPCPTYLVTLPNDNARWEAREQARRMAPR